MYKFRNVTTKEDLEKSNEWADRKICLVEHPSKIQKVWNVKDRFGKEFFKLRNGLCYLYSMGRFSRKRSD